MSEFDPTTDTGGTQLQGSPDTGEGVLMEDWDALVARVSSLEQAPAPGPLTIDQLPLADLQRELTNNWAPSGQDLLLPHSVTKDQLDVAGVVNAYLALASPQANAQRKVDFGSGSVSFSAASLSSVATITHALGVAPTVVIPAIAQLWTTSTLDVMWGTPTTTTFQVQMTSNVAITGTLAFSWLAIA